MRLFQRRGEDNPPQSVEEIQRKLNHYASVNADTTVQEDRLHDQLDQLGLEAEYQGGWNTYKIKPASNIVHCYSCGIYHSGPACD